MLESKLAIKPIKDKGNHAYYCVQESNLKRLIMVWFQLHNILEKAKIRETVRDSVIDMGSG